MSMQTRKTMLLATDQQKSVLKTLDVSGCCSIAYTVYGHRPPTNGLLTLVGFNGELPDPLTRHYHLGKGYRQLNPVLMRFNSPDSWSPFGEGGLNAYGYCAGDPINSKDPTGHTPEIFKNFLRKFGLLKNNKFELIERQLINAQKNTLENIHISHSAGQSPREAYETLLKLDKTRQLDARSLMLNPEITKGRTQTNIRLANGDIIEANRIYYNSILSKHASMKTSELPIRSPKIEFSEQVEIREIKSVVRPPLNGWSKVSDIRSPSSSRKPSERPVAPL
ncbi:hypothetical protein PS645_00825 [Pseudomonas fluorescens]|uniref:RHS repeat-associated core domain-containing protein n=1 Tax=Pseudomonas fluorescens TaxID=294 RepID=A0A5E6QH33_PSEFL|nr:RHS repeat-associated core domain-containing protein [Pseudomonas fluorescens]VVM52442.1 hypothetical protein PS645_00825 [Pseudomonas fluorescens]